MPGDRKRDIEVFTEAIQLPDEERLAFLDRTCAENHDAGGQNAHFSGEFLSPWLSPSINAFASSRRA